MSTRPTHEKYDRIFTDNDAGYHSLGECPETPHDESAALIGDPLGEASFLVGLQDALYDRPFVLPAARALSLFGEHSLGWVALGVIGGAIDVKRRECWLGTAGLTFVAHATGVLLKRLVRRPRPHDERVRVGVGTPSQLSFPSSHCTSTTTALICISALTGHKSLLTGIPVMMLSRMVLGVHYPTDVVAGATLGAAVARVAKKRICPA